MALGPEVALGEIVRHITPELLSRLNDFLLTEIELELEAVTDCRDPAKLGLAPGALVRDYDFSTTQDLASAAIARGVEAVQVPSATGLGDNVIVFPANLHQTSRMTVTGSRDPRLYVSR
jgi:hypothetical protein